MRAAELTAAHLGRMIAIDGKTGALSDVIHTQAVTSIHAYGIGPGFVDLAHDADVRLVEVRDLPGLGATACYAGTDEPVVAVAEQPDLFEEG